MELVVTAKVKLLPTVQQKVELASTLKAVKEALNFASQRAYDNDLLSSNTKLHSLVYLDLRSNFRLKSQMACNVCSVVAGNYASLKSNGENTLIVYKKPKLQYSYNRDYPFTKEHNTVRINTLNGRIKVPFLTAGVEQYFDDTWEFGTATLLYI